MQFQVRAAEQIEAPVEEPMPGVDDMDRPISAVKLPMPEIFQKG